MRKPKRKSFVDRFMPLQAMKGRAFNADEFNAVAKKCGYRSVRVVTSGAGVDFDFSKRRERVTACIRDGRLVALMPG